MKANDLMVYCTLPTWGCTAFSVFAFSFFFSFSPLESSGFAAPPLTPGLGFYYPLYLLPCTQMQCNQRSPTWVNYTDLILAQVLHGMQYNLGLKVITFLSIYLSCCLFFVSQKVRFLIPRFRFNHFKDFKSKFCTVLLQINNEKLINASVTFQFILSSSPCT